MRTQKEIEDKLQDTNDFIDLNKLKVREIKLDKSNKPNQLKQKEDYIKQCEYEVYSLERERRLLRWFLSGDGKSDVKSDEKTLSDASIKMPKMPLKKIKISPSRGYDDYVESAHQKLPNYFWEDTKPIFKSSSVDELEDLLTTHDEKYGYDYVDYNYGDLYKKDDCECKDEEKIESQSFNGDEDCDCEEKCEDCDCGEEKCKEEDSHMDSPSDLGPRKRLWFEEDYVPYGYDIETTKNPCEEVQLKVFKVRKSHR